MSWWEMNQKAIFLYLALGIFLGVGGDRLAQKYAPVQAVSAVSPKLEDKFSVDVTASGYYRDGPFYRVVLSDGRTVVADQFRETPDGWQAKVGQLWYRGNQR